MMCKLLASSTCSACCQAVHLQAGTRGRQQAVTSSSCIRQQQC